MSIFLPSLAAAFGACLFGLLPCGCKCSAEPAQTASPSGPARVAPSAPLPKEQAEPSHCRPGPGLGLTLEADAPASDRGGESADEDDEALLPFGVVVGAALPTPFGFVAAGIRGAGQAFVALLGERASRRVDLGEVHGDAETPALAVAGEGVLVALRSSDAAGFTIKLGRLKGVDSSSVEWGYELPLLGKSVTGVELAVSGGHAVLVYQGEDKGNPRLLLGTFSVDAPQQAFEVERFSPLDAETPRLVPRTGGFWLSWVRALPEAKRAAKPKPKLDPELEVDPEEGELLELGLRVVEVAKLDEQGRQQGEALRLGEPKRQVLLFDVAPLSSGGLLVAMRSDSATPGAEAGPLLLSEVGTDGSVRQERLGDDDIGAGAPLLLFDAIAQVPKAWLSVSTPSDLTRLGVVRGAHTVLESDPMLGRSEVIAVGEGRFLAQRARGRKVELVVLDCQLPGSVSAGKD